MNDQYTMFDPTSSEDTDSAISSPESDFGPTLFDLPDGTTNGPSGPAPVPVPPSQPRAKVKGLMTLATSGRYGFGSSESQDLQSALGNRLMQRLDTAGSTLGS